MGTSRVHVALQRLVERLADLGIPYAVCGGMALNAHGYERLTTDVDLVMTAEGLQGFKARALGLGWIEKFPGSRGMRDVETRVEIDVLVTGGVPGDGTPRGVTFPDPSAVAVEIAGARYVSLAALVEMKIASGLSPSRLKDLADVIELIRRKRLGEHFADTLHPAVRRKYAELWRLAQIVDPQQE